MSDHGKQFTSLLKDGKEWNRTHKGRIKASKI